MMVAFREGNIFASARLQDSRLAPRKEPTRVISTGKPALPAAAPAVDSGWRFAREFPSIPPS
jgi:hypothetical protein